jgi:hypothetical protein
MACKEMEPLLAFYACDELDETQRNAVAAHLDSCADCQAALERERRLLEVMQEGRVEPPPMLLASCRNELSDALELAAQRHPFWQRLRAVFQPPRWALLHPAWSAAMFLVIGVVVGTQVPQWLSRPPLPPPGQSDMTVSAPAPLADLQNLQNISINTVPGADSDMPDVEVHGTARQPWVFKGTPADQDVRRVLSFVLQNSQRFDPGARIDSADLLRMQGKDSGVREALCHAALHDRNAAVRLKALEALRGFGQDPKVGQTLIDVLLKDENPGVRVEAITALRTVAEQGGGAQDARLLEVLRDRMQRDPNMFVRLQSAAAVRQLEPRATY